MKLQVGRPHGGGEEGESIFQDIFGHSIGSKNTSLLERELGNAQELLREFKAKHRAQWGGKPARLLLTDKGRRSLVTFFCL